VTDRDAGLAATERSPVERTATHATAPEGPAAKAAAIRTLGRYQLERELGVGGMGIVHAALDPELERRVAIKLILRATSDEARARLLREARAMARLTHPNIITIYEIGSEGGRDFVTMELIDGGSLSDWLRSAPRSQRDIIDAFLAAGRGLAAAHEAGIVHRDFKPHNVLRSSSGRIVVGDFGLATGLDTQVASADIPIEAYTTLTATGSWVGTPAYMAPEQWNGGAITPATDQFAFCVALWEALAGQRPFRGDSVEQLRGAVTGGPDKLDASRIPMRLRPVLRRGLDPDPAKRWPNMTALLAALRPDRKKLYVGGAALVGLALSISVVVLALTRGAPGPVAADPFARKRQAEEALAEATRTEAANRFAAQVKRDAARAARDVNRELANALREGTLELDLELLQQVRRMANGKVMAPQHAIEELVDELQDGKAVQLIPTQADGKMIGFKAFAMKPGTFVDAIGLSNGDVITAIGGRPVTTQEALQAALDGVDSETLALPIEILRGQQRLTIVVEAKELEAIFPGPQTPPGPPEIPRIESVGPRVPPTPPADPWAP
jgi:predicted Ser/Thr protein kinase